MITLKALQAAYPGKRVIHAHDKPYFPNDIVTLADGVEIRLDTNIHTTFLKEEVAGEYFNMMMMNKIGELPLFKDRAIKTIVIANARIEGNSRQEEFLTVAEGGKALTYTFLAGGK